MMNEKTLRLLEFDTIRQRVASCALSEEAALGIRAEIPLTSSTAVDKLKALVQAILKRIESGDEEKREPFPDLRDIIPRLGVDGLVLELDEAYALAIFVERATELLNWLAKDAPPPLEELIVDLPDCKVIPREVFRVIDREGKLRDLPEFQEINRRIRTLYRELDLAIAGYASHEETRYLLQSPLPSQKDGRIVMAVKANFRGRINGIVHEVSSSGQTLFIEPVELVEKNNAITMEQQRLRAAMQQVLRRLSATIAGYQHDLMLVHERIVYLETHRAKARYTFETKGHFALPAATIQLKQARHPLLSRTAVPIDFVMKAETKAAIITGPNTGGKTVALKTIGLFALMNQMGLAVPADEGTSLPIFDGVYADIGDEQSLSQSLSTFSAHITTIASLIDSATDSSLVLLDELGSGTDPAEGSALAMAILDHFIAQKAYLIVTTHHSVLKNYGWTHAGVENASVEFDRTTLSPTYHIVMGIPGESRALEIAGANGLQPALVQKAYTYLNEKHSDVSALIAGLKQKHRELEAGEKLHAQEALRLREERRAADLRELRLRQKENTLKAIATGNLHTLLIESRKQLENLVRELREGELSKEKTRAVKEFLSNLEETVRAADAAQAAEDKALEAAIRCSESEAQEQDTSFPLDVGATVLAGPQRRCGTVLRADKKGFWYVEIGSVKMRFSEQELQVVKPEKPQVSIAPVDLIPGSVPELELKLLGMHLDEALDKLRRQLDIALLNGCREFAVIHGKGDGILRRGVHDFLSSHPSVVEFHFSRPELGGFGRTEVVLK
ncbi:MAG: endonuclease MutS2 [Spirochaetaceae bacterium]|jgi:DNA mismatch repair protein MutS2|nr:endonuclease MutS2 [Spirochaetaceae bacterium]